LDPPDAANPGMAGPVAVRRGPSNRTSARWTSFRIRS
jgi:hypothetical protein